MLGESDLAGVFVGEQGDGGARFGNFRGQREKQIWAGIVQNFGNDAHPIWAGGCGTDEQGGAGFG
jgi:hypothetical protein